MKVLVCGSRKKFNYSNIVRQILDECKSIYLDGFIIIEGCCKNSADEYAEKWAKDNFYLIEHFPATSGYLKRNIEMVKQCDKVIAFWDSFSYGTSQTIAYATYLNKPVRIIMLM